jgi:hypothetical protein
MLKIPERLVKDLILIKGYTREEIHKALAGVMPSQMEKDIKQLERYNRGRVHNDRV